MSTQVELRIEGRSFKDTPEKRQRVENLLKVLEFDVDFILNHRIEVDKECTTLTANRTIDWSPELSEFNQKLANTILNEGFENTVSEYPLEVEPDDVCEGQEEGEALDIDLIIETGEYDI